MLFIPFPHPLRNLMPHHVFIIQQTAKFGKHHPVGCQDFLLHGIDSILLSLNLFWNQHAGKQAMKSLLTGEFHGMTPYSYQPAAMMTKLMIERFIDNYLVKILILIVLPKIESPVAAMTQQHDPFTLRKMIHLILQEVSRRIVGYYLRSFSII